VAQGFQPCDRSLLNDPALAPEVQRLKPGQKANLNRRPKGLRHPKANLDRRPEGLRHPKAELNGTPEGAP